MNKIPNLRRVKADDSYTFLLKELEKCDETIQEPLTGTDWPRDMPVVVGGGFLENIASYDVVYASTGGEDDNIFFEPANDIPVIQADFSKQTVRCFNWAEFMSFSLLEREKMEGIGRDPQTFLDKGIRLHCDHTMDRSVYRGMEKAKSTGLCNNPNVIRAIAPSADGTSGNTQWANKTADQILRDINQVISDVWKANDCSSDALPNHILVPVQQFGLLVTRKVSDDSERSILSYVLENNLTNQQGGNLTISPCKWCSGAGTGSRDRLVCYMNRVDRICFNLTVPLRRMETEYAEMRIKIPYIAQFSEVRFLYPTTVRYLDGI